MPLCVRTVTYPFSQYSSCNHAPKRWETSAGLTCKYICAKNFWVSSSWNEHGASKGGILKKGKDHLPNISFKMSTHLLVSCASKLNKNKQTKSQSPKTWSKIWWWKNSSAPVDRSFFSFNLKSYTYTPWNYQSSPLNIGVLPQRWKPTQTPCVPIWGAFADSSGRVPPSFSDRNSSINSLPP